MCYGTEEECNVRGVSESYLALETLWEHLEISYRLRFLTAYILGIISRVVAHMRSQRFLCSVVFLSSRPAAEPVFSGGRAGVQRGRSSTAARLWWNILQNFHTGWQMTAPLSFQISPTTLALRLLLEDIADFCSF